MSSSVAASFVQDELRPFAMKLHTKDQAPKEGQQRAQVPFTKWEATRSDYLRFLVDSLEVYDTVERLVSTQPGLSSLRDTGMERSAALRKDIEWMHEFDPTLPSPGVGAAGASYAAFLTDLARQNVPGFVCHFYNQYFAHTAGGLRIGQFFATKLLGGKKLHFYTWQEGEIGIGQEVSSKDMVMTGESADAVEGNDHLENSAASGHPHARGGSLISSSSSTSSEETQYVPRLKEDLQKRIDALAQGWTPEQRRACCEETSNCFRFGQALLGYLSGGALAGAGRPPTAVGSSAANVSTSVAAASAAEASSRGE